MMVILPVLVNILAIQIILMNILDVLITTTPIPKLKEKRSSRIILAIVTD